MTAIRSYKDLVAWQKAMDLVVAVYRLTATFPAAERFGLTAQARRAAVGVPSNIAEGYARRSAGDYVRFLHIARGSANELETQLLISEKPGLADGDAVSAALELTHEVQRILNGLVLAVQKGGKPGARR